MPLHTEGMHKHFSFDFLKTISEQLYTELETNLPETTLNPSSLAVLRNFQIGSTQGVYVLYYNALPMYIGKADDIHKRLSEHYTKLSGRMNIDLNFVGYKALYLDASMSTAANERLIISIYESHHTHQMWNGGGFGAKDPGGNRDNTEPGSFDVTHPIIQNYGLSSVLDRETIGSLFAKMKTELPFVFRYQDLAPALSQRTIDLSVTPKTAIDLFQAAMKLFPGGWQGAVISYGMVAYNNAGRVTYRFADKVFTS